MLATEVQTDPITCVPRTGRTLSIFQVDATRLKVLGTATQLHVERVRVSPGALRAILTPP